AGLIRTVSSVARKRPAAIASPPTRGTGTVCTFRGPGASVRPIEGAQCASIGISAAVTDSATTKARNSCTDTPMCPRRLARTQYSWWNRGRCSPAAVARLAVAAVTGAPDVPVAGSAHRELPEIRLNHRVAAAVLLVPATGGDQQRLTQVNLKSFQWTSR